MRLAAVKKTEPANFAPENVNAALSIFEDYETRRKEIGDVRRDLVRAERALAEASGQVERAQKIQAAGGKIDARSAAKGRDEWAAYVETLKSTLENYEKHASLIQARIERMDLEPITAELETLTREQRTLERRIRRGYYAEDEEPTAKMHLAEVSARLKSLQPCAEALGQVQAAARQRVALRSSLPAIESAAKKFEAAMNSAEAAQRELQQLGEKVGWSPDFFMFRMAVCQHSGQQFLEHAREEIR